MNNIKKLEKDLSKHNQDISVKQKILMELAIEYKKTSLPECLEYALQSLKIAEKSNDLKEIAKTLCFLGEVETKLANYTSSIKYLENSIKIAEKFTDHSILAKSINTLAQVYWARDDFKNVMKYSLELLQVYEDNKDEEGIAVASHNIGLAYRNFGKNDKALAYYLKSLETMEKLGNESKTARILNSIGIVYEKINDFEKAFEYYNRALKKLEKDDDTNYITQTLNNHGNIFTEKGEHKKAIEHFKKSLKYEEKNNYQKGVSLSLLNIGYVYEELGEYDKALNHYQHSLKIREKLQSKKSIAVALTNIASIHSKLNDHKKSENYLKRALKIAEDIGSKDLLKEVYQALHQLYKNTGKYKKALDYYTEFKKISEELQNIDLKERIEKLQIEHEVKQIEAETEILKQSRDELEKIVKERTKKLKETNQLLETIVDSTHALIAYLNPQFNFIRVNTSYAKADKRKISFFPGKNHFDLYPNAENEKIFTEVVQSGESFFAFSKPFEYADHPERGISFWDWSLIPIKDQKGFVSALVLSLIDVTSQQKIKEKIVLAKEEWEQTFDSVSDIIMIINKDYKIVRTNKSLSKKLGLLPAKIVGTNYFKTFFGDENPPDNCPLKKVFSDKKERSKAIYNKKFDRYYLCSISPLKKSGNFRGVVSINRDITGIKKTEAELKKHQQHIELINKILRHDLTNNLIVIRSAIRLYQTDEDKELLDEATNRVISSVELIRKMKNFESVISSERQFFQVDVENTIRNILKNYKAIEINIHGKAIVLADEAFDPVINNIIQNSVVHGKASKIEIKMQEKEQTCEIRIEDNGIGIPDEVKKNIFEEGFKFGEKGHTGLGLFIVKNAIKNYGGNIRVEDNIPNGTVFILELKKYNPVQIDLDLLKL